VARLEGSGVPVSEETIHAALDDYTAAIRAELRRIFGLDAGE
jgi:hypothetical protein